MPATAVFPDLPFAKFRQLPAEFVENHPVMAAGRITAASPEPGIHLLHQLASVLCAPSVSTFQLNMIWLTTVINLPLSQ